MGKTITTYLIDGTPKGTQYVFISNSLCKMYIIPRLNRAILDDREELQKPALYMLLGEDENAKPKAYIGETENFRERVKDHESKKTFWQRALVFVAKDENITKADVQYLEHRAIADAKEANTFVLNENKQIPKAPNLPEYQRNAMDEFFEDVKFLATFCGCNIFETVEAVQEDCVFYIKSRGCDAKGFYNATDFTVLRGSILAKDSLPSLHQWREKRDKLIAEYASMKDGKLVLDSDKTFSSPSTAADFCTGSSNNGWTKWKNKDGETLDAVYRK